MKSSPAAGAKEFCNALIEGIVIQSVLLLLFGCMLDGGWLGRLGLIAQAGWAGGAILAIFFRWKSPTRMDLVYLRYGYLLALVVTWSLSPWMGFLRN